MRGTGQWFSRRLCNLRQAEPPADSRSCTRLQLGTGLNLPAYRNQQLTSLTAVDISEGMLDRARARAAALPLHGSLPVAFQRADAAALPFPAASFDCVLDTFSLCVLPDGASALAEAARVLRPGGRLLLLEHARSEQPMLGAYQDATANAIVASGGGRGCLWNQRVGELVAGAGFEITFLEQHLAGLLLLLEARLPLHSP